MRRSVWPTILVAGVVLAGVIAVARSSSVAPLLWRKFGGFPDMERYVRHVDGSILPWKHASLRLLDRAAAEMVAAREATPELRAKAFREAATLARLSLYLLYGPICIPILVAGVLVGRRVGPLLALHRLELEGTLVVLDTTGAPRPAIRLPEAILPVPPRRSAVYALPESEVSLYQRFLAVAREHGLASDELAAVLQEYPLGRVAAWRRHLASDLEARAPKGLTESDLRRYEAAWSLRPAENAALPSMLRPVVACMTWRRAFRALGRGPDAGMKRALLRLGVPPRLLRVREELRAAGHLTPLHERLLGILAAHPHHPGSVDHHDSEDGGLIKHKVLVLREGLQLLRDDDPSFIGPTVTCLVAHDLGKIVSYERDARQQWAKHDELHAQNTALILTGLDEFRRQYTEAERLRITMALKFDHRIEGIPLPFASECEPICSIVHTADGHAVGRGAAESSVTREAAVEQVMAVLPQMIRDMAINRVGRSSRPDGFYERSSPKGEEIILLLEGRFRDLLKQYLDRSAQRSLGLWTKRVPGEVHPAWEHLARAFLAYQVMPASVRGVSVDAETKLLSIVLHERVFRGVFPINPAWLLRRVGDLEYQALIRHWSSRAKVDVRRIVPGVELRDETTTEPAAAVPPTNEKCPACGEGMKMDSRSLACSASRRRCQVKYEVRDGVVQRACSGCGKPLRVVRPRDGRKPPFVGCPDPDDCKARAASVKKPREETLAGAQEKETPRA